MDGMDADIQELWEHINWCRNKMNAMTVDHALRGLQIANQPERIAHLEGFIAGALTVNPVCDHKQGSRIRKQIMKTFQKIWPDIQSAWASAPKTWMDAAVRVCINHVEKGLPLPRYTQTPENPDDGDQHYSPSMNENENTEFTEPSTENGWGNGTDNPTVAIQSKQDAGGWSQTTRGDWGSSEPTGWGAPANDNQDPGKDENAQRNGWSGWDDQPITTPIPRTPSMTGGEYGSTRTGPCYGDDHDDLSFGFGTASMAERIYYASSRRGYGASPVSFRIPHDAHQYVFNVSPPPKAGRVYRQAQAPESDPFASKEQEPKDPRKKRYPHPQPSPLPRPRDPQLVKKRAQLHGSRPHSSSSDAAQLKAVSGRNDPNKIQGYDIVKGDHNIWGPFQPWGPPNYLDW